MIESPPRCGFRWTSSRRGPATARRDPRGLICMELAARRPNLVAEAAVVSAEAAAAVPTAATAAAPEGGGHLPSKVGGLHPDDQQDIVSLLSQGIEQNFGTKVGTGSGPTDLSKVISSAMKHDEVDDEPDWSGGSEEDQEEGHQDNQEEDQDKDQEEDQEEDQAEERRPEPGVTNVTEIPVSELKWLTRKRRRSQVQEGHVNVFELTQRFAWILRARR